MQFPARRPVMRVATRCGGGGGAGGGPGGADGSAAAGAQVPLGRDALLAALHAGKTDPTVAMRGLAWLLGDGLRAA